MLTGQSTRIDKLACWSVSQPGEIVRYVGRSVNPDRQAGMLVGQPTLMARLICWWVIQPG